VKPLDPVKEETIIRTVFSIAGKQGIGGINMHDISREANVGVGTLYTYFKSKDEIIQVSYARTEQQMAENMYKEFDIKLPLKESFRQIYLNAFHYRLKHYNETVFMDQYIQSNYKKTNLAKLVHRFEQQNQPLYDLLRKGQKEGIFIRTDHFTLIIFILGAIRASTNGIKDRLIPLNKQTINQVFQMIWKAITNTP
jgi:AcrR family transcriptional regulator